MVIHATSDTGLVIQKQLNIKEQTQPIATTSFSRILDTVTELNVNDAITSASVAIPLVESDLDVVNPVTSAGAVRLLSADALASGASADSAKPSIRQFMDATGSDFDTASSILYGVIGSNLDFRDWNAIMASSAPLADARSSTAALYSSDLPYTTTSVQPIDEQDVLAKSGLFAFIKSPVEGHPSELWLMDSTGRLLRNAGFDPPSVLKTTRDFGLNLALLGDLAAQLDAKGIAYKPGELAPPSTMGTDYGDLARGGLGTLYDWRIDPLVAYKGPAAVRQLASNQALAREMGIHSAVQ